jgi:hypothetical protein
MLSGSRPQAEAATGFGRARSEASRSWRSKFDSAVIFCGYSIVPFEAAAVHAAVPAN